VDGAGVHALAVDRASRVFVGGDFAAAGDEESSDIAVWTAAAGACTLASGGAYTFYPGNLPVTLHIVARGTLTCIHVQRVNRSHGEALAELNTGYYWQVQGLDSAGNPAAGYQVDLTLPMAFTPDGDEEVCRFAGGAWDCAASSSHPATHTVTRLGLTQLSDFAVADPDLAPPTATPTATPSATVTHTATATPSPTATSTRTPTVTPTSSPTTAPTLLPTHTSTASPTHTSTVMPTATPSASPTHTPTLLPSATPTRAVARVWYLPLAPIH
jgi:hypothetical protein